MPISNELKKLYADAFERGIFVKEFPVKEGFIAFASSFRKLERGGFTKEKRDKMSLWDANIWMAGAGGDSREEAVEKAINVFLESEDWGIPTG